MAGTDVVTDTPDQPATVRVVVADGTQFLHEGTLYAAGETFEATLDEHLRQGLAVGWLTEAPKARQKR